MRPASKKHEKEEKRWRLYLQGEDSDNMNLCNAGQLRAFQDRSRLRENLKSQGLS